MTISIIEDAIITFDLSVSDPNGDILAVELINSTNHGSLLIDGISVTYEPESNYFGSDNFSFKVNDGTWESASALVTFNVIPINDSPTSTSFTIETNGNITNINFNDYIDDLDGDILSILTVPPASSSTLTTLFGGILEPLGDLYYEYLPPDESVDFLLYKASDGLSQSGISIATFVNGRDEDWRNRFIVPTALDDNISMQEDGVQEINFVGFDLYASIPQINDALDILSGPNNGTITDPELSSSSTAQLTQWNVNYTPNLNFSGTDEIRFTVSNPSGTSDEGTILITITPVNDLPVLADIENVVLDEDGTYSLNVSHSDVRSEEHTSNSSHVVISYAVFCLKKKKRKYSP